MHRVIGERDLSETPYSPETARQLYRDMVRARQFDQRALALQRRGWMSGYPPYKGQEGSQVAAAHAMAEEDWLFPTYRSNAMLLARGVPMSDILLFRRGHAEFTSEHDVPTFPVAVPIATQIPHAVGAGMAMNYQDDDGAVLCYFGDGATSEGDFHEGMNFAGVFEAPVVFFCENNGWAISLPRDRQTASDSIAGKAQAYGFDGGQVDGNDPLAVREMVGSAIEAARAGSPTLVESLTYRQGAHSTSDDPSRYRENGEGVPDWRTADPIDRYESYLREQDVVDDTFVESVHEEAEAELDEAIERAENEPAPEPEAVFDSVYQNRPRRLTDQQAEAVAAAQRHDLGELDH
jgi:pyruvate dehydrogenase E1 component alpha subunit